MKEDLDKCSRCGAQIIWDGTSFLTDCEYCGKKNLFFNNFLKVQAIKVVQNKTKRKYLLGSIILFSIMLLVVVSRNNARGPLVAGMRIINKQDPDSYGIKESTIRQELIRGEYGRYISFMGRSKNRYEGTVTENFWGGYSTIPGGTEVGMFKYMLDCEDKTFDRKGDKLNAAALIMKGWSDVSNDLTATYAAEYFCPRITRFKKKQIDLK